MLLISFKSFWKNVWKYMCKVPLDVYIIALIIIGLIAACIMLGKFFKSLKREIVNFISADKERIRLFTDTLLNDYEDLYNHEQNKNNDPGLDYQPKVEIDHQEVDQIEMSDSLDDDF